MVLPRASSSSLESAVAGVTRWFSAADVIVPSIGSGPFLSWVFCAAFGSLFGFAVSGAGRLAGTGGALSNWLIISRSEGDPEVRCANATELSNSKSSKLDLPDIWVLLVCLSLWQVDRPGHSDKARHRTAKDLSTDRIDWIDL